MTVLFMDGLEAYGASGDPTNMEHSGWATATISAFTVVDGHVQGKGFSADTAGGSRWFRTPLLTTGTTLVIGCHVFLAAPNADRAFLELFDGDNALGMNIQMLSTGELRVRRGTTTIESTTTVAAMQGQWIHLEWKVVCHPSAGTHELKINGSTVLNNGGSTFDTQANAGAGAGWHQYAAFNAAATGLIWDDIVASDGSFLGPLKVITLFPDAAGDDADFTPSAGNNYQAVDETPSDTDSTYVQSATTDHQDLHGVPAPSGIGTIVAVQHTVVCRKTDVTDFDVKLVTKSDDTESVDSAQTVDSTSYTAKRRILANDPDTAAPWADAAAVGAAQFGYRVG